MILLRHIELNFNNTFYSSGLSELSSIAEDVVFDPGVSFEMSLTVTELKSVTSFTAQSLFNLKSSGKSKFVPLK